MRCYHSIEISGHPVPIEDMPRARSLHNLLLQVKESLLLLPIDDRHVDIEYAKQRVCNVLNSSRFPLRSLHHLLPQILHPQLKFSNGSLVDLCHVVKCLHEDIVRFVIVARDQLCPITIEFHNLRS